MKRIKNLDLYYLFLFSAIGLLFTFSACEPEEGTKGGGPTPEVEVNTTSTTTQVQRQFYHSWLAYCTSGETANAPTAGGVIQKLTQLGKSRIKNALADTVLQQTYYPTQDYPNGVNLAWGPVLTVEYIDSLHTGLTNNLMYVLEANKGDTTEFYIGIAGTNMISHYDWFVEDFDVSPANQQNWLGGDGQVKGKIANGTSIGLNTLLAMVDSSQTGMPDLLSFLNTAISDGSSSAFKISVTGHSLGGALSPVLALKLKQQFTASNLIVDAWPFAGPTPGNANFATYLTSTLDDYQANNNAFDVVPHIWQADSMNLLCDLYNNMAICDGVGGIITIGAPTLGVLTYFREKSAGGDYTVAGKPTSFSGDYSVFADREECGGFIAAIGGVVASGEPADLVTGLLDLIKTCQLPHFQDTTLEDFEEGLQFTLFFSYMAELGGQHTTAYFDHFVQDTTVQNHMDEYITGAKSDVSTFLNLFLNGAIGLPILEDLVNDANATLKAKGISNCDCSGG